MSSWCEEGELHTFTAQNPYASTTTKKCMFAAYLVCSKTDEFSAVLLF